MHRNVLSFMRFVARLGKMMRRSRQQLTRWFKFKSPDYAFASSKHEIFRQQPDLSRGSGMSDGKMSDDDTKELLRAKLYVHRTEKKKSFGHRVIQKVS